MSTIKIRVNASVITRPMRRMPSLVILALLSIAIRAQQPGSIDLSFNAADQGLGIGDGAGSGVRSMLRQPDGKVILVGDFGTYNGVLQQRVVRLNADGTRDATYPSNAGANGQVHAAALQPDGKLIIVGFFTTVNGVARKCVARLNADGTLDTSFNPGTGVTGGNQVVYAVARRTDGTIVIGGSFSAYNGVARNSIARLLANGSLDTSFDPGTGPLGEVNALCTTSSGRLIVGGWFPSFNGVPRNGLVGLNANGSVDLAFATGTGTSGGQVACILERADGSLYIGGNFAQFDGLPRRCTARLFQNGTVDPAYGSDAGPDITGNLFNVRTLVEQADGKVVIGGLFTSVGGVSKRYLARLTNTGSLEEAYPAAGSPSSHVFSLLQLPDGHLMAAGTFTQVGDQLAICIMRLNTDGALDPSFNPGNGFNGGGVRTTLVQPDQRIIVLGDFLGFNGTVQRAIVRLLPDGTYDGSFSPGEPTLYGFRCVALQTDGKVLVGGNFDGFAGTSQAGLVRLNSDGSLDAGFTTLIGAEANNVETVALQPDGKILIGGNFTTVQGQPRNGVARLLPDGSLDPTFEPGSGADLAVLDIEVLSNGKIIIAGFFTTFNGTARNRIARLNPNGSLDSTFEPGSGADQQVQKVIPMPDGRLLISGGFTSYNGVFRRAVARLLANGTLDTGFETGINTATIGDIALCSDGRILIAGSNPILFSSTTRPGIARLLPNGALDPSFDAGSGASGAISSLALLANDKMLIGGSFLSYNGTGRNRIARIHNGLTPQVALRPRVLLDGPFVSASGWMNDQLRSQQLLPFTEPYSTLGYAHVIGGGETTSAAALATSGQDAIVDWVVVELRGTSAPHPVIASRSALVQRDGDVVDVDGTSPVGFSLPAGSFQVAIRHRNHLGVMTAAPMALSANAATIDFTSPSTPTWGTDARKNNNGTMTLWAGDTTFDGQVKYVGSGNDRDPILLDVGGSTPTNTVNGAYAATDVNLDGVIKYVGNGNDRDPILLTIGGSTPTAVRVQQLP